VGVGVGVGTDVLVGVRVAVAVDCVVAVDVALGGAPVFVGVGEAEPPPPSPPSHPKVEDSRVPRAILARSADEIFMSSSLRRLGSSRRRQGCALRIDVAANELRESCQRSNACASVSGARVRGR
jgi:hypothetical protein